MLIIKILQKFQNILSKKSSFRRAFLLAIPLTLIFIKPKNPKIHSDQSLYEILKTHEKVFTDYKDLEDYNFLTNSFTLGNFTPSQAVKINCEFHDLKEAITLYSTLKTIQTLSRPVLIEINIENFMSFYSPTKSHQLFQNEYFNSHFSIKSFQSIIKKKKSQTENFNEEIRNGNKYMRDLIFFKLKSICQNFFWMFSNLKSYSIKIFYKANLFLKKRGMKILNTIKKNKKLQNYKIYIQNLKNKIEKTTLYKKLCLLKDRFEINRHLQKFYSLLGFYCINLFSLYLKFVSILQKPFNAVKDVFLKVYTFKYVGKINFINRIMILNYLDRYFKGLRKLLFETTLLTKDEQIEYFAEINLRFTNSSATIIHPMSNIQPNSDLLYLTYHFFDRKYIYKMNNTHIRNRLNLDIGRSSIDIKKLISLIKCICNMHSHSLGTYYYIPHEKHFDMIQFLPIVLSIVAYIFLVEFIPKQDVTKYALISLVVLLKNELIGSIIAASLASNPLDKIIIISVLYVYNFRVCVLYCVFVYCKLLIKSMKFVPKSS